MQLLEQLRGKVEAVALFEAALIVTFTAVSFQLLSYKVISTF